MLLENWRKTKNRSDYCVSDLGRVKSPTGHILKQADVKGYCYVALGKIRNRKVHRLVAEAFIDNPDSKPWVNHKDGNKKNNCATNLEWSTISENQQHATDTGLRDHPSRTIKSIDTEGKETLYAGTIAAEQLGYNRSAIRNVLSGRSKTHAELFWEYV